MAGRGTEARVIAEDLVAREPWERANIERFRRALTLLGVPDVDAVIAERLSGQSPFTSTDFLALPAEEDFGPPAEAPVPEVPRPGSGVQPDVQAAMPPAAAGPAGGPEPPRGGRGRRDRPAACAEEEVFEIGADGFDLGAILDGGTVAPRGEGTAESHEIDLSSLLDGLTPGSPGDAVPGSPGA